MSMESNLYNELIDHEPLQKIISNRWFPGGRLKQNPKYPAATYQRINNVPYHNLNPRPSTIHEIWLQFDIYSDMHKQCVEVREKLIAFLDGFKGVMGALKPEGEQTRFQGIFLQDDRELPFEGTAKIYRTVVEFTAFVEIN